MRGFIHSNSCAFFVIPIIILMGCFLFGWHFAVAEEITDFSVDIQLAKDSSLLIEETIIYDFGEFEKHGIYRDIPVVYSTRTGDRLQLDLRVNSITDQQNKTYDYSASKQGDNLRIKVGSSDVTLSGTHVYKISYQVYGAIGYFDQHDELYWNVTGNAWAVSIGYVQVRFNLPQDAPVQSLDMRCYTGSLGNQSADCTYQSSGQSAYFFARDLGSSQGLTIVVGWPKGIINQPSLWQKSRRFITVNPLVFLPLLVFVVLFLIWRAKGRDEPGKGAIVPQYEVPRKLTPGEVGVLVDEKVDNRDITCTIIDLARRGYLRIQEIKKSGFSLLQNPDWELTKSRSALELAKTNQHEWEIFNGIFANQKDRVKLSQLKNFYQAVRNYKKVLYSKVVAKKFFAQNPNRVRVYYFTFSFLGVVIIVLAVSLLTHTFGLSSIASFVVSLILCAIFSRSMPKKTHLGKIVHEEILGFKMFLSATEKDRVKFHFSPAAHPQKFVEYVPYAIALGVEKEWAKVFQGITLDQSDWYQSQTGSLANSMAFIVALNSFSASSQSSFTSQGSTAAGGASGFSGGFSGGGFGGGGGGSW